MALFGVIYERVNKLQGPGLLTAGKADILPTSKFSFSICATLNTEYLKEG